MEFLNKIQLRGVIGRADVNAVNGTHVCNFSVVTEYSTRDKEGNPVVDVMWFNVAAWEGRDQIRDVYEIRKGMWVEVTGRVRMRRYVTQENEERSVMDVIARKIKILEKEEEQMQPQRDY
ncbi:MAG: single-stranded DNA-binding protein [Bacteroidales bacterium]|nr:single-stranded DNA-binding protein [Bacteroidales bacterium]